MDIPVHNQHPLALFEELRRRKSNVVEETEPRNELSVRMVARRSHQSVGLGDLAGKNLVGSSEHGIGCHFRSPKRLTVLVVIFVEPKAVLSGGKKFAGVKNAVDVALGVERLQVGKPHNVFFVHRDI